jgi:two-component system chemotaxis response regulator CheY
MSISLDSVRFLLMDDNHHMRAIVATILRSVGVRHVREASDGAEGLEALNSYAADIAICDFKMGPMDGVEFTRTVRQPNSRNTYLPIIMMTGFSDRGRIFEARDAGVTEILAKPITAAGLLSRVDSVIMRPRPFIRTASYFGPCRRRIDGGDFEGVERRGQQQQRQLYASI